MCNYLRKNLMSLDKFFTLLIVVYFSWQVCNCNPVSSKAIRHLERPFKIYECAVVGSTCLVALHSFKIYCLFNR